MKKIHIFTAVVLALLTVLAAGCSSESASMSVDLSDEKTALIEMENATDDHQLVSGTLAVEEGEEVVIEAELSDGSDVLIEYYAGEEEQDIDEVPELSESAYETEHKGSGTMTITVDPGYYYLRVTPQSKSTGKITMTVRPIE